MPVCSSEHFSRRELQSQDGACDMGSAFLEALEHYRRHLGRPVHLTSGYRSVADNQRVGGAPLSQHLYGRAVDLARGSRMSLPELRRLHIFTGLGVSRDGSVSHVDTRPGSAHDPVVWYY